MKKYDNEVYENIPNVTSCEDQTENIEVEKLGEIVNVKRRMGKKILIGTVFFIIVSFVGFAIGRPFYNNGEVTNRTITLNIDLRDIKGKYTGTIKDGLPDGNGRFTYTVGKKDIRYTGTFSKGKFINGMGYMVDNQGNVAYHGEFKNGLPDEKIFKEIRQSVTGYSLREWALDENLFKCYQQIGTITQVNQWGGTENGVCLYIVTGGNNNGNAVKVFYENEENMTFCEGNLLNWEGRLTHVPDGNGYPEAIAYFVDSFTETSFRQQIYDSILNTLR